MSTQYKVSAAAENTKYTVALPTSKSISNRALILNALAYSNTPIKNLSDSDDTQLMIKALTSDKTDFDIGAAGTTMRFLTAFLSKIVGQWTITGSSRMKQRPIKILVEALNKLGAKIEYMENEGYPPLRIFGSAMEGGDLELPGDVSSQYISALLMIGPGMQNGLRLTLTGEIISRPYILLTLKMMETFGVKCDWKDNVITVPTADYKPVDFTVEADWSAASYWFQIAALNKGTELNDHHLTGLEPRGVPRGLTNTAFPFRYNHVEELEKIISSRKEKMPKISYTAKLIKNEKLIKAKIIEEAGEVILENKKKRIIEESSDLIYHLMVLWQNKKIDLNNIVIELKKRNIEKL